MTNCATTNTGPVAQWITRLPTEQKIAGSIPASIDFFFEILNCLNKKFIVASTLNRNFKNNFIILII
jgi:hypothetical protein